MTMSEPTSPAQQTHRAISEALLERMQGPVLDRTHPELRRGPAGVERTDRPASGGDRALRGHR